MPGSPVILGRKHPLGLEDFTAADAIPLTCPAAGCGHDFPVAPHRLLERSQAFDRRMQVCKVMVCLRCGDRRLDRTVTRASPPLVLAEGKTFAGSGPSEV